jgi:hypothetical protein
MVIRAIDFFLLPLISDLTQGLAAAYHHRLADYAGQQLQPLHRRWATSGGRHRGAHRQWEALIAAVAATRKTMDEARVCERAAALVWEKEETVIPCVTELLIIVIRK